MNHIIKVGYDIMQILPDRRKATLYPFWECDSRPVHELPWIATTYSDLFGSHDVLDIHVKVSFGRGESHSGDASIDQDHHGGNHCHVHHDFQAIGVGGYKMGEIKVLLYEFEEDLNHPSQSVSLQHIGCGNVVNVSEEVDNAWVSLGYGSIRICDFFRHLGSDMSVDRRFRFGCGTFENTDFVKFLDPYYLPSLVRYSEAGSPYLSTTSPLRVSEILAMKLTFVSPSHFFWPLNSSSLAAPVRPRSMT